MVSVFINVFFKISLSKKDYKKLPNLILVLSFIHAEESVSIHTQYGGVAVMLIL